MEKKSHKKTEGKVTGLHIFMRDVSAERSENSRRVEYLQKLYSVTTVTSNSSLCHLHKKNLPAFEIILRPWWPLYVIWFSSYWRFKIARYFWNIRHMFSIINEKKTAPFILSYEYLLGMKYCILLSYACNGFSQSDKSYKYWGVTIEIMLIR